MTTNLMKAPLAVSLFAVIAMSAAYAQTTVIVQKRVAASRILAGHVDIGVIKAPAENITVEVRSSNKGMVLASTKADAKGYFHLDTPKSGGMFYLRLSGRGVNPCELRVRVKNDGPPELQIHVSNAT
jgi:hypothetical protein